MSTYTCSGCNYSTKIRSNVAKHIKNVTKCFGSELIITVNKVQCPNCPKEFENEMYLKQHQLRCKVVVDHPLSEGTNTPNDLQDRVRLLEQTVDRLLRSHIDQKEQIDKQQKQIIRLTKLCTGKQAEKPAKTLHAETPQIKIIEYRKFDGYLKKHDPKIRDKIFLKAIKSGTPVVTLIESLFFDEKLPRLYCMCIKNKRTNEIKLFEDKCWQTKKADETIPFIINHCKVEFDDWACVVEEETNDSDAETDPDPFEKDKKAYSMREGKRKADYDVSEDPAVIESVRELLYNKRDMIKC